MADKQYQHYFFFFFFWCFHKPKVHLHPGNGNSAFSPLVNIWRTIFISYFFFVVQVSSLEAFVKRSYQSFFLLNNLWRSIWSVWSSLKPQISRMCACSVVIPLLSSVFISFFFEVIFCCNNGRLSFLLIDSSEVFHSERREWRLSIWIFQLKFHLRKFLWDTLFVC